MLASLGYCIVLGALNHEGSKNRIFELLDAAFACESAVSGRLDCKKNGLAGECVPARAANPTTPHPLQFLNLGPHPFRTHVSTGGIQVEVLSLRTTCACERHSDVFLFFS